MKYVFAGLTIELTRRCNMACKHCLRGDAQNITITREIIDKIFADTENCIQLYVSGGEPLLGPDMLKYLIERASTDWNRLINIEITSNGSVLDATVVDALEQFCRTPLLPDLELHGLVRKAALVVSNDQYHVAGICQKALDFYRPLFDAANNRLGAEKLTLKTWSPVNPEEIRKKDWDKPALIYAGRGVDLIEEAANNGFHISFPPENNHRLKITGPIVHCRTMITSRGDVVVAAEDDSYASYDANAVGNIMLGSLTDIIDDHQNRCVLSCNESRFIDDWRKIEFVLKHADDTVSLGVLTIKSMVLYEINSNILKLRKMLKKTYPILPAQDIIAGLSMVQDDDNLNVLIMRIVENTHWSLKEELKDKVTAIEAAFVSQINDNNAVALKMCCEALVYLKNNGLSIVMKLRKQEMKSLSDLVKLYTSGERKPQNNALFACGDSGTFANQNDISEEYSNDRKMADFYRAMNEYSQK